MKFDISYIEQHLTDLAKYCEETGIIDAVYLFGSVANQTSNKLSDIDFGILLNKSINFNNYFDLHLKFLHKFSGIFETDKIDIVILNNSPCLLSHSVIKNSKILFCTDENRRIEFEVKIMNKYLDFKPFLNLQMKYMKEQIERGDYFDK
jgi:uncharacterized protein